MDFFALGEVLLRALLSLAILFGMTKLMGRKQVSQLTPFDYIIGISIGSIAAELAVNRDTPIPDGVAGLLVYSLAAVMFLSRQTKACACAVFSPENRCC